MSSTASVSFGDRNIWAYDVALSILLAEVIYLMDSLAGSLPKTPITTTSSVGHPGFAASPASCVSTLPWAPTCTWPSIS